MAENLSKKDDTDAKRSENPPSIFGNRPQGAPTSKLRRPENWLKNKILFQTTPVHKRHSFYNNFRILGRLRPQDGPELDAQTDQKKMKTDAENDQFLKASWIPNLFKQCRFGKPNRIQVGTNIEAENDLAVKATQPNSHVSACPILISDGWKLESKSIKNRRKQQSRYKGGSGTSFE